MPLELKKIKASSKNIGFFRFKELNKNYLLTNDVGFYIFLTPSQFKSFVEGKLDRESAIYKELKEKGFTKDLSVAEKEKLINVYRSKNFSLFRPGPSLHIVVLTLRCNFKCVYCQAASELPSKKEYDMTLNTARQTVDYIFKTPVRSFTIEFQGGEPLINWPALKFIVEYARKKSEAEGKDLNISLVSNLTLMTDEKLRFLMKNRVDICTSLDGPEELHNKNRPWVKGNGYKKTTYWIRRIKEKFLKEEAPRRPALSALITVSRNSLKYPKEIIEEYLKWGFPGVHLRPLTYLGFAQTSGNKISYSAEEFMAFWKKAMDYIISLNKDGIFFQERETKIILQKILTSTDPGYTDLMSPCGAALGQIAYNYNGDIYTCDEGRMFRDDTFLIGNVEKNGYRETILNNKVKTMLTSSCLENAACDYCAYKPYCGVCPVRNYIYYGNLFPQMKNTDWCKIKTAQFDYIFDKMKDEKIKEIFERWVSA